MDAESILLDTSIRLGEVGFVWKLKEDEMSGGRKYSRNEKIFYVISVVIVFSMIFGMIAVAVTPAGF